MSANIVTRADVAASERHKARELRFHAQLLRSMVLNFEADAALADHDALIADEDSADDDCVAAKIRADELAREADAAVLAVEQLMTKLLERPDLNEDVRKMALVWQNDPESLISMILPPLSAFLPDG